MTEIKDLIINEITDNVMIVSKYGEIKYVNEIALKTFELDLDKMKEYKYLEFLPDLSLEKCLCENDFSRIDGRKVKFGKKVFINKCIVVNGTGGHLRELVLIMSDITNLRLIAEDLGKCTEDKVRLEKSLDTLDSATVIVDSWGKISNVNVITVDIFKEKGIKGFMNRNVYDVLGKNIKLDESLNNGMIDIFGENGEIGTFKYLTFPIYLGSKIMGHLILLRDNESKTKFNFSVDYLNLINTKVEKQSYDINSIVGQSQSIINLKSLIKKIAKSKTTVLLESESGTGKELFAQSIHSHSSRADKPFIKVNCASLPDNLLESELFGFKEGAFTGARKGGYKGRFELANGGTIFLDEVGEISLSTQAKLLRVLQEHEIQRLGDEDVKKIDVRIVCATNKNLKMLTEIKAFRKDLYYRLNVAMIVIPPLRDRKEDIQSLVIHFLRKYSDEFNKKISGVSPEVYSIFKSHNWPGNVRELGNVLEYAFNIADEKTIQKDHLPNYMTKNKVVEYIGKRKLDEYLAECEKKAVEEAIDAAKGNKVRAAKALGISRAKLYRIIDKIIYCE